MEFVHPVFHGCLVGGCGDGVQETCELRTCVGFVERVESEEVGEKQVEETLDLCHSMVREFRYETARQARTLLRTVSEPLNLRQHGAKDLPSLLHILFKWFLTLRGG